MNHAAVPVIPKRLRRYTSGTDAKYTFAAVPVIPKRLRRKLRDYQEPGVAGAAVPVIPKRLRRLSFTTDLNECAGRSSRDSKEIEADKDYLKQLAEEEPQFP